ncbi:hypothetical protein T492DRAFT_868820, partial [Pavlovales sp. CCMP2436]
MMHFDAREARPSGGARRRIAVLALSLIGVVAAVCLEKSADPVKSCNDDDACHANELYFTNANALGYVMTKQSVSPGQPFYGISTDGNKITVYAGRHKTGNVAADFNNGITIANALMTNGYIAFLPDELNFAVFGTFTFSFPSGGVHICRDFRIAQGRNAVANNWWIGSAKCLIIPTQSVIRCDCGVNIEAQGNDNSDHFVHFVVTEAAPLEAEYLRKARAQDRVFGLALPGPRLNGPNASIGPIEAKLNPVKPIRGIVIGAFGEVSADTHSL